MRTLTLRATVAGTAALCALGAGTALSTPAVAAPKAPVPTFLATGDLPPHDGGWTARPVGQGLPSPGRFCMDDGVFPDTEDTYHRDYQTDRETNASQVTTTVSSEEKATELVKTVRAQLASCASRWLAENPGATASWDDFGGVEGGHVYGVHVAPPESANDLHLLGVGSSGKTVTVVAWGEYGTLKDAPVDAFRKTTATAVTKLG